MFWRLSSLLILVFGLGLGLTGTGNPTNTSSVTSEKWHNSYTACFVRGMLESNGLIFNDVLYFVWIVLMYHFIWKYKYPKNLHKYDTWVNVLIYSPQLSEMTIFVYPNLTARNELNGAGWHSSMYRQLTGGYVKTILAPCNLASIQSLYYQATGWCTWHGEVYF